MLTLMLMAATIEVRKDGPALTVPQARALTPEALAAALLVPDHPPIVEAFVGRGSMYPPSPPGMLEATEIRLFTVAVPSSRPGFCEKTEVLVTLAPVMRGDRELPPARAAAASPTTMYRWAHRAKGVLKCEAPYADFFKLDPKLGERAFTVIRALAALKAGSARDVRVSIDDRDAREMKDFVRRNAYQLPKVPKGMVKPITSNREALSRFPISSIASIRPYVKAWDNDLLRDDDLSARNGHPVEAVQLFAGEEWNTGVVLQGDRIVTVRFVKAMPPPF